VVGICISARLEQPYKDSSSYPCHGSEHWILGPPRKELPNYEKLLGFQYSFLARLVQASFLPGHSESKQGNLMLTLCTVDPSLKTVIGQAVQDWAINIDAIPNNGTIQNFKTPFGLDFQQIYDKPQNRVIEFAPQRIYHQQSADQVWPLPLRHGQEFRETAVKYHVRLLKFAVLIALFWAKVASWNLALLHRSIGSVLGQVQYFGHCFCSPSAQSKLQRCEDVLGQRRTIRVGFFSRIGRLEAHFGAGWNT
jgi:hypothetical protein